MQRMTQTNFGVILTLFAKVIDHLRQSTKEKQQQQQQQQQKQQNSSLARGGSSAAAAAEAAELPPLAREAQILRISRLQKLKSTIDT